MNKKFSRYLFLATFVLILIYIASEQLFKPRFGASDENPYNLNLDSFNTIDSNLIAYKLLKKIKVPLQKPKGIAISASGYLYVSGDSAIVKLDFSGNIQQKIITSDIPYCLYIHSDNRIYAGIKNHVEVYDSTGKQLLKWEPVNKDGFISSISGKNNTIFVADAVQALVYLFTNNGTFKGFIGSSDSLKGAMQIILPSYFFDVVAVSDSVVTFTNQGKHFIVNARINNTLLNYWGVTSPEIYGFSGCCNPSHIAIAPDGSVITSEKGIVRVKRYKSDGTFKDVVAGSGSFVPDSKGLDLAVDKQGNVYVLEPYSRTIHVFQPLNN